MKTDSSLQILAAQRSSIAAGIRASAVSFLYDPISSNRLFLSLFLLSNSAVALLRLKKSLKSNPSSLIPKHRLS